MPICRRCAWTRSTLGAHLLVVPISRRPASADLFALTGVQQPDAAVAVCNG